MFEKIKRWLSYFFRNARKQTEFANKTQQELKKIIEQWDFSKQANAQSKQRVDIEVISAEEERLIRQNFRFKYDTNLWREIDSHQIIHTLKRHGVGGETNDANIPIDLDTILQHYPKITKDYDVRKTTTNNKIIYAKQINGHFIVFEEILSQQNKVRYFDAWQTRGKLNEQELFKNVAPNADESASPSHHESGEHQNALGAFDGYSNPTTKKQISQEQKKQAHLAREAGIKKSLDLLKKKQSKSADTTVSNISSDSIKNETKPKFRKMFQKKDNINNKDKK